MKEMVRLVEQLYSLEDKDFQENLKKLLKTKTRKRSWTLHSVVPVLEHATNMLTELHYIFTR